MNQSRLVAQFCKLTVCAPLFLCFLSPPLCLSHMPVLNTFASLRTAVALSLSLSLSLSLFAFCFLFLFLSSFVLCFFGSFSVFPFFFLPFLLSHVLVFPPRCVFVSPARLHYFSFPSVHAPSPTLFLCFIGSFQFFFCLSRPFLPLPLFSLVLFASFLCFLPFCFPFVFSLCFHSLSEQPFSAVARFSSHFLV